MSKTPEILFPALRQYSHNNRKGELFAGFDYDITVDIVKNLLNEIEGLEEENKELRDRIYNITHMF